MHLNPLLTDHAVIQRHQSIPVWGWTDQPRTRVRASLADRVAEGVSGDDSRFLLRLPPLPAGGPHRLTVETLDSGERVKVNDILIGEVWLASGQSNMSFSMSSGGFQAEIDASEPSQIRMFTVERRADHAPQSTVRGAWELSTPQTVGDFSAAACFFGNRVQEALGIPVGIIHSSWGGSFIETWISRERLVRHPRLGGWVTTYERHSFSPDFWGEPRTEEEVFPRDPGNQGMKEDWHKPDLDDSDWDRMQVPGHWQSQGHNFSGVFWFRKRVTLPPALVGQALVLELGAVDKHDITYVNGVEVGRTGEGLDQSCYNTHRTYTIPAELNTGPELLIAVRAYSFVYAGGLTGPAEQMQVRGPDPTAVPLAGPWRYQVEHNLGRVDLPIANMGHGCPNSPGMLFENMIRPLLPVAIAGAIWYQGESNAGRADEYCGLMIDLIEDWRYHFASGDFPLIQVQLANFRVASDFQLHHTWPYLREAQTQAMRHANTGMAVIIDAGEADDIHPKDKRTVGFRLAQWALARTYGLETVAGSPVCREHHLEGDRIRVCFDEVGTGLALREGERVETLVIAGEDGEFKPARSRLEGSSLVAWHEEIPAPVAVRYAWADNPVRANLVNSLGYPASPFRTDA